jgi:hypothetical protein
MSIEVSDFINYIWRESIGDLEDMFVLDQSLSNFLLSFSNEKVKENQFEVLLLFSYFCQSVSQLIKKLFI